MRDLEYVTGELTKGKNLHLNLPGYANSMMNLYHGLAYIKFCMNYYTFFEIVRDSEYSRSENEKLERLLEGLNEIVGKELLSDTADNDGASLFDSIESLDNIRNEVMEIMEVVTAYIDRLRIYEHAANRIEYRFREEAFDDSYYNNGLTNDLMHYIFSDKDSVAVNNRISEVVEQLPMRLTKNKFYEYLREAFTLYKDAQKGTVDDFAYAVRTSGMLFKPKGFETAFPEVYEIYRDIASAGYQNISKADYEAVTAKLEIAEQKISDAADNYLMFIELVNDLYTLLLSKPYVFGDVDETIKAGQVVEAVLADYKQRISEAADGSSLDNLMDSFISFEGKQERIGETVSANDFAVSLVLENYPDELAKEGLSKEYEKLAMIIKLQSGSDFVRLTDDESRLEEAKREYTDKICGELIEEFAAGFEGQDRLVRRAVMSSVLSQIPVFFNSVDEIQGYINMSLMSCSDASEKQACVEVLKLIMQE